ncbi:Copper-transporting P-type ATPase [uncultured Eubacterium sp.]|uniref:heavy metal translocating P-type ATPase n=1 Tax=Brotomerdimonas butyrica TaxID=2981721 RepID=UPI00082130BD|nr:heavy metal translocating P-type ATPase [Brotomerdimonas butyrica]MCU6756140.1 heavy metal translocating P-type ATPase [Brotomerdimonas butyrica]SCH67720.1 Copper-transporting P-type ATPase [uncultured Eubacterium sp.]
MKFRIKHEIEGRIRIEAVQNRMTFEQADTLQYYLDDLPFVKSASVQERTQSVTVCYDGDREQVLEALKAFSYEDVKVPEAYFQSSGRKLNREYWEKLVSHVTWRGIQVFFIPYPIRGIITAVKSVKYIKLGIMTLAKRKIEVPVLDATAIAVSMIRGDLKTAGSIMFLLGIGEILEEWTHKKSVDDLARSMSLNVGNVWLCRDGEEDIMVPSSDVEEGDLVRVYMGTVVPFDGTVVSGEAMVNQASLTGESLAVRRAEGASVYAGTIIEEGELVIRVNETSGGSKYEKIAAMIEETEKLKSSVEGKAAHLADKLVPYTLLGTVLVWALTRNVTKALSVLMVDFSCALKLAMPISVLSAMREAGNHNITVKGGKYMEAMAEADTIIFDKTGTLTKARPVVADVISFGDREPDELLRIAACLEEHFPHSMAKAVVNAAKEKGLEHEELHSDVEYIVAHGISTMINGKKAIIGSYHFIFDDEECIVDERFEGRFDSLSSEYSHLYMAIEGKLEAVICIHDPLREEAAETIRNLKAAGIKKVVMMTGDSDKTARAIAAKAGVDEYYAEVLPEDKARFVEQEKQNGSKVIMIGDGINDSPALSAADVGIAISDGAEIAREIADITIAADDLGEIVVLKELSVKLMERIHRNYRRIVGINGGLILLGVSGVVQPTTSALIHNISTLGISLKSMENLL